jgi:hypothetical protein
VCGNIAEQLLKDVSNCVASSLQLDESTDIGDSPFTSFHLDGFKDFSVNEEVLGMISLKGRMGQEILNVFYSFVKMSNASLHKLVFSTTDGAKSMTSQVNEWFYCPL